jgi:hypothetical protein
MKEDSEDNEWMMAATGSPGQMYRIRERQKKELKALDKTFQGNAAAGYRSFRGAPSEAAPVTPAMLERVSAEIVLTVADIGIMLQAVDEVMARGF